MILCACIYFFMCRFMDYSLKKDISLMRRSVSFLYYTGVLIVEIIKSNLQVMHLTLTDREIVEVIHCLDKTIAEGIENSTFEQLLERMEKQ